MCKDLNREYAMNTNLFSFSNQNQGSGFGELPKIKTALAHTPRIRVKSEVPQISLTDDNLFFNIDGNEYSIDDFAEYLGNLFD